MNIRGIPGERVGHATVTDSKPLRLPKIAGTPKQKGTAAPSKLAARWEDMWRVFGDRSIEMVAEHKFHPERKWRFDFAFPSRMVAVEIDGGVHTGGRHTRGKGYEKDCEKLNAATSMGWRVLRLTGRDLAKTNQVATIDTVLEALKL